MQTLGKLLAEAENSKSITLSTALAQIAKQQRYLAFEVQGMRYNIGMQYGVLVAQLALALSGKDRDKVLTEMVELLAFCPQGGLHE